MDFLDFLLQKEKEFEIEYKEEPHATPSNENQADEAPSDVALSDDCDELSRFWSLWQECKYDLYQNCFKLMGNQQDAEDVLAEVMLKGRRAWEQPEKITNPKGLLFRISSNLCFNTLAKRRDIASIDKMIEAGQELPANVPLLEEQFISNEMRHIMSQTIAGLPPRLRECARQYFLLEIGYEEIAHNLHVSTGNVRKRIQEVRSVLKKAATAYLSGQVLTQTLALTAPCQKEPAFESNAPVNQRREINAPLVSMFVVVPVSLSSGVVRTFHLGVANKPARLEQKLLRWQAYVEQHPGGFLKRLELAEVLYLMGRWEEAIDTYQGVLVKQPRLLEVSLQLGHMLHLLERKEDAIEVYRNALSQARQPASKHHLRGLIARLSQQYDLAVTEFEAAITFGSENVVHWHELGQLHLEREAYEEALRAFDGALALNPNGLVALSGSYEPLVALGHHQEAQQRLSRILELAPKDVRTLTRMAHMRLQMGLVHGQEGKESKQLILTARREAPHAPDVSALLASYYFYRGNKKKGTAVLHAFVCEYPKNPRGWIHYAHALQESGQEEAAQEAIDQHASLMAGL